MGTGWTGWVECMVDIPETVMSTRAPVVLIIICIKNSLCVMAKSISQGKIEMNTRLILYSTLKNLQPVKKFFDNNTCPNIYWFIDVICVTGGASKIKRTLRPDVGWFFQQYSIFIYKIVIVSKLRYYQLGGGGFVSTWRHYNSSFRQKNILGWLIENFLKKPEKHSFSFGRFGLAGGVW